MITRFPLNLMKMSSLLFSLYVLTTFFLPTLSFNKLLFVCLMGSSLLIISDYFRYTKCTFYNPFVLILFFFYGYILALVSGNCKMELSNQFLLSQFSLLMIYPITYFHINLDKIIKLVGGVFCLFTISFFVILLINPGFIFSNYDVLKNMFGFGIADRELVSSNDQTFSFTGSYHMFLPLGLFFYSFLHKKTKKFWNLSMVCLLFFAIVLSGARGQIAICLLIMVSVYLFDYRSKFKPFVFLILLIGASIGLHYILTQTVVFSPHEFSNNVKQGEVEAFFSSMQFQDYIIGRGLASPYYVPVVQKILYHTEITFLDMVRYVGIGGAIAYYFCILFPVNLIHWRFSRQHIFPFIMICALCLYSLTNPNLNNSLGYIVVVWYWSKIISYEDKRLHCNV